MFYLFPSHHLGGDLTAERTVTTAWTGRRGDMQTAPGREKPPTLLGIHSGPPHCCSPGQTDMLLPGFPLMPISAWLTGPVSAPVSWMWWLVAPGSAESSAVQVLWALGEPQEPQPQRPLLPVTEQAYLCGCPSPPLKLSGCSPEESAPPSHALGSVGTMSPTRRQAGPAPVPAGTTQHGPYLKPWLRALRSASSGRPCPPFS